MPSNNKKPVFTYQTRVSVTSGQDGALSEYAALFGRVERTLYADIQKGEDPNLLKSSYLVHFDITARQFNAVRIQLQGKMDAARELLPLHIKDLQTKIRKAKKTIAKLAKRIPGSNQLHQKRRRLLVTNFVSNDWKPTAKQTVTGCASGRRNCSTPNSTWKKTDSLRTRNGNRRGPKPGSISSSC
jgi:hypothetical protein